MGVLPFSFYRGCFSPFLEGQWRTFTFLSNEGGRNLHVFFLFPIGGRNFFSFSEEGQPGCFFLKKGAHCPCYFPTLQRGRSLHTFISFPEGAPPRTFLSLQRGRSLWVFSHSQRGAQFPYFFLLCLSLFVLFKYGLPSGFEFKETRFHLYIMYFDRLNIISVLKEMKKSLTS